MRNQNLTGVEIYPRCLLTSQFSQRKWIFKFFVTIVLFIFINIITKNWSGGSGVQRADLEKIKKKKNKINKNTIQCEI